MEASKVSRPVSKVEAVTARRNVVMTPIVGMAAVAAVVAVGVVAVAAVAVVADNLTTVRNKVVANRSARNKVAARTNRPVRPLPVANIPMPKPRPKNAPSRAMTITAPPIPIPTKTMVATTPDITPRVVTAATTVARATNLFAKMTPLR